MYKKLCPECYRLEIESINSEYVLRNCYPKIEGKKKCKAHRSDSKRYLEFIYGYCTNCNKLITFLGTDTTNISSDNLLPIELAPSNILSKSIDLRNMVCSKCGQSELKNIFYYDGHFRTTIKTAIFCNNCKLVYYFKNDYFYPIISIYSPIHIEHSKLIGILNEQLFLENNFALCEE